MTVTDRQKLADDLVRVARGTASDQEKTRILDRAATFLRAPEAADAEAVVALTYTNYRGETAVRTILPVGTRKPALS